MKLLLALLLNWAACCLGFASSEAVGRRSRNLHLEVQQLEHQQTRGSSSRPLKRTQHRVGSREILGQMQSLLQKKGKIGLTPAEKAFIEEIQELWMEQIMPAINSGILEGQEEVNALFKEILDCEAHLGEDLDELSEFVQGAKDTEDDLKDCVEEESDLLDVKKKECKDVKDMKVQYIEAPARPGGAASNQEKLEYLKAMNDFFCGVDEEFLEHLKECSNATTNHANLSKQCTKIQHEYEADMCEFLEKYAQPRAMYEQCRKETVERYQGPMEGPTGASTAAPGVTGPSSSGGFTTPSRSGGGTTPGESGGTVAGTVTTPVPFGAGAGGTTPGASGGAGGSTAGGTTPPPNGLLVEFFYLDDSAQSLDDMDGKDPDVTRISPDINYPPSDEPFEGLDQEEFVGAKFTGVLLIDEPGDYTFVLGSDDGSTLTLDDEEVISNKGPKESFKNKTSPVVPLEEGEHPLLVEYIQYVQDAGVVLYYSGPDTDGEMVPVPSAVLRPPPGITAGGTTIPGAGAGGSTTPGPFGAGAGGSTTPGSPGGAGGSTTAGGSAAGATTPPPNGLLVEIFYLDDSAQGLDDMDGKDPDVTRISPDINYPPSDEPFEGLDQEEFVGAKFTGVLLIDEPGDYTFVLGSDDGSTLTLDDEEVISNTGPKESFKNKTSPVVPLEEGEHPLLVEYIQYVQDAGVVLYYSGPDTDGEMVPVPSAVLRPPPGITAGGTTISGAGAGGSTTPGPLGAGVGGSTTPGPFGAGAGGSTTPGSPGGAGGSTTAGPVCEMSNEDKVDCGFFGMKSSDCEELGCCWHPVQPNPTHIPWCYHSTASTTLPPVCQISNEAKVDCGYHGIAADECEARGCCYHPKPVPNPEHIPYCYHTAATSTPVPPGVASPSSVSGPASGSVASTVTPLFPFPTVASTTPVPPGGAPTATPVPPGGAVARIKELELELQKEYIAAVRIECLWDAWDLAETPCLVDEDKVDECFDMPINLTNYTIIYPEIPDPHDITDDENPFTDDHPCTGDFIEKHYGHLDIDEDTFAKMKKDCKAC